MLNRFQALKRLDIVRRYLFIVFPEINREINRWRQMANRCPDPELRKQALASLTYKRFHCHGGGIFAVQFPDYYRELVGAITAFQTISDYLDNLCDRAGVLDEKAFRQLHLSITGALDLDGGDSRYYSEYPYCRDGGYLEELVTSCRRFLTALPSFLSVKEIALRLAGYYCNLQATKHLSTDVRRDRTMAWIHPLQSKTVPAVNWWEMAAATGSTLGIFALMSLATKEKVTEQEIAKTTDAYFPWINGLHILLDYYIDQEEDREGGDMNFCAYYADDREACRRLHFFLEQSLKKAGTLPDPVFHVSVVQGLLAMYLSDVKAGGDKNTMTRRVLLSRGGGYAVGLYRGCILARRLKIL